MIPCPLPLPLPLAHTPTKLKDRETGGRQGKGAGAYSAELAGAKTEPAPSVVRYRTGSYVPHLSRRAVRFWFWFWFWFDVTAIRSSQSVMGQV